MRNLIAVLLFITYLLSLGRFSQRIAFGAAKTVTVTHSHPISATHDHLHHAHDSSEEKTHSASDKQADQHRHSHDVEIPGGGIYASLEQTTELPKAVAYGHQAWSRFSTGEPDCPSLGSIFRPPIV